MSEPKWTPWPWPEPEYDNCDRGSGEWWNIGGIARTMGHGYNARTEERAKDEANARLIASAPELYEALESYVVAVEELKRNNQFAATFLLGSLADKARAALAKARGEGG